MAPSTLKRYNPRLRRGFGFCLAALMLFEGAAPSFAQSAKALRKALLPAPGNVGIVNNLTGIRDGRPAITATQHPLFESSWTGRPDEIVAQTKYGSVTSSDLYLWMILRESPNKAFLLEAYQQSRLPSERKLLAQALQQEIDEYVFTNLVIPRLMPAATPDEVYNVKHHVYTLPAWQTVFLSKVVAPSALISPADRQKYLQEHEAEIVEQQRLRTRYIFMKSPETAVVEEQDRVEVDMDELRSSILRGEVDFAAAARQHSQAPSASNGGEIPPFQHGELFFLFENAAANLEPGGISPVFRGPNGYYMVQLIEVLEPEAPSLDNTRHAALVEEGLSRQVLRAAYNMYMRDMLLERRVITEKLSAWDQLEDCEALGEVCNYMITKGQFRSAWPEVESNNLKLRTDIIAPHLRTILEREAMAQEVRELGLANDPILERARQMAGNIIRREAWVDQLRATLPISEQLVRNFWEENPNLFTPLALKRVIRLTLTPSNTVPLPAQTRLEMDQVLARATGQPETVTIAKRELLDEERSSIVYDNLERTETAFEMMTVPDDQMNFYLDQSSTASVSSQMNTEITPLELPSLEGEPAPGLDTIPAPAEVSPDTLDTLDSTPQSNTPQILPVPVVAPSSITSNTLDSLEADRPANTETLDLATTKPQGGAAPGPAAGGNLDGDEILPDLVPGGHRKLVTVPVPVTVEKTPAVGRVFPNAEENEVGPAVPNQHRSGPPATRPRAGSVPVGVTAPAVAPAAPLEPTPNISKQQPPPSTSAIPYNPEWFYARLNSTQIKSIIGDYASSDWLLTMNDLGFVYLEDLPDAPRTLEQVPVGAFSRPILRGLNAVSWYIEDARTVEKQPFEKVKTHAYDVFRQTQIDKAISRTYDSELEKAAVDYKF